MKNWIVGIDEVGRGPLAGPVTLAALAATQNFKKQLIKILGGRIRDSKQFSPKQRYTIYRKLLELKNGGQINFGVSHISNKIIDKKGISCAIKLGVKRCLNSFFASYTKIRDREKVYNLKIKLDGTLKAPKEFKNQKTIIKGDEKDVFIACASIVAKVRRDRLMCRLASKYPLYAFQIHKGYGTKLHYKLLKKHGFSDLHRKSFCSNIKSW